MDIYDTVLAKLRADPRNPYEIAEDSGIPRETIRDILDGKRNDPRISTIRAIAAYYEMREAA